MKKIALCLIFCFFTLLSSCGIIDDDSHVARDNMLELVNYIESNDTSNIKKLFSDNVLLEINDIDNEITSLCEFYTGSYKGIVCLGLGVDQSYDYGKEKSTFNMSYVIETDITSYYFSILWIINDDYETKNIGIWSIIIEEKTEDKNQTPNNGWVDGITIIN